MCSGLSMGETIAGLDRVKRFWLDIAFRVVNLHKQRKGKTEEDALIGINRQIASRETSKAQ